MMVRPFTPEAYNKIFLSAGVIWTYPLKSYARGTMPKKGDALQCSVPLGYVILMPDPKLSQG